MKFRHNGQPNRHARKEAKLAQRKVRAIAAEVAWENTLSEMLENDLANDRRLALIQEAQDAIVAAQLEQDAEFLAEIEHDRVIDQSGVLH